MCAAGVVALSACSRRDPPPTRLAGERVPSAAAARDSQPFFTAWAQNRYIARPVPTQIGGLDDRMYRIRTTMWVTDDIVRFAAAHPGHLYFNGDEPDQQCVAVHVPMDGGWCASSDTTAGAPTC